ATPTTTLTPTATPTVGQGMVALAGRVLVPGQGGLPADHGQVPLGNKEVDLFLCAVRKPCMAMGEPVASIFTDANGRFRIIVSASLLQGTLPVVLARVNPSFVLRAPVLVVPVGQALEQAAAVLPRQVGDTPENLIDSISEAAVRLLEEQGFENYNPDGVAAVVQAVEAANAAANFEDLTPQQAADMAQTTAASDPGVQMALMENHSCPGDCDGLGGVTVDEIITGVDIALGTATFDTCAQFDLDHNGVVTINELIVAVNNALHGCTAG
ncbi:MAG TPA: hypothetical protein VMW56_07455, partial [Candidatus Margulisiibacteriota bacterium]|nr:hypothetical protein [Candidatus Margulisiibacteriota bacterium]